MNFIPLEAKRHTVSIAEINVRLSKMNTGFNIPRKLLTGFISGIIFKVLGASTVFASGGTGYTGGTGDENTTLLNPLGATGFAELVQKILGALWTLSIPLCSIMIMVGGYYIMSAAGNEERLKTGRNTILYAAIGFAVITVATGVVSLIRSITGV